MRISNLKVYDLEESLVASGYPFLLKTPEEGDLDLSGSSVKYWREQDILKIDKLINEGNKTSTKYQYNKEENCIKMFVGNSNKPIQIDYEDALFVSRRGWTYNPSRGYIQSTSEPYIELQNYLMGEKDSHYVVDHINRDPFDNRRSNLRFVTHSQNTHNRDKLETNTSGVTGVFWSAYKQRWVASIEINSKKITRTFLDKEQAIKKRLEFEKEYLKEFAPQKHLFEKYGIELPEEKPYEYPEEHFDFFLVLKHLKRGLNLTKASRTNGAHAQWLTGVRVNFDLTFSNKAWVEAERYRFLEFVSSQSTMHRISRMNLTDNCNEYVDSRILSVVNELKEKYLETKDKEDYLRLLYNIPAGFELTARMTTNYRCLLNIYNQRHDHRLPEWREFCEELLQLPYFKELVDVYVTDEN